jgi:IS1 family transposase
MNRLTSEQPAKVVSCLIEGCSIRSTVRMTGVAKKTVLRLVVELGTFCANYQDRVFRNLKCERMQVDECWSFVYAKQKDVTPEIADANPGAGDAWLWAAIDAATKLVPCWYIGPRSPEAARDFVEDLAGRLSNRIQLTSDGLKLYIKAVDKAFGGDVDYAMLVKVYGIPNDGEKRYSPAVCLGCESHTVIGTPDPKHINTSYIERHNLSVRMTVRRFTRLTNAFSKKIENHVASVALGYNFIKIHRALRTTPAMAAGVTDRLWEVSDLVSAWETWERNQKQIAA